MAGESRAAVGLIASSVRRPIAVSMVVLAVAVFGYVSLTKLPVTLLPDVSYPTLTVRTEYEGAAPADIEKLLTRRLEEVLAVVSNLARYRSISRAGVSDIILEFEWKTPMTFAAQDVREKVDQVLPRLPEGVKRPLILRYDPALDPIMRISLFADGGQDLQKLREVAEEDVRRKLENLPGVAAVKPRGGYEEEWRIELHEDLLKLHGIASSDVTRRVGEENANVAGGILHDGDRESLVRTLGEITSPDELRDFVVASKGNRPIRIRELGDVIVGHKDRDVITRIDGRESVELEIFKEAEANTVKVAQDVKTRLFGKDWKQRLGPAGELLDAPAAPSRPSDDPDASKPIMPDKTGRTLADTLAERGIRTRMASDQSIFIQRSIDEVRDSAIEGGLLAIAILFVFLRRVRPTLIIGVSIPVSIIATFGPLFVSGISLNIMSLGGLALGIGMLVDASIVVLEVITRHEDAGKSGYQAAIDGTREVSAAVASAVLTTIAVFLPIVFVEGVAGEFFRDQAVVVVVSQSASMVAAILFIPMLSARRLAPAQGGAEGRWRRLWRDTSPIAISSYVSIGTVRASVAKLRTRGFLLGILPFLFVAAFEAFIRFPLEFLSRVLFGVVVLVVFLVSLVFMAIAKTGSVILAPVLFVFDRGYAAIESLTRGALRAALKARLALVLGSAALCALAARRLPELGVELMPVVHQGEFTVESQLDVGTPVEKTDEVAITMTATIRRAVEAAGIELAGLSSSAGVDRTIIAKAGDGKHTARVHVLLARSGDLAKLEDRAISAIRRALERLPEVREPVFTRPSIFTTKTALELVVAGQDLDRIHAAAKCVEVELRKMTGLTEVQSTDRPGHPELVVRPDREQLAFHRLTAGGVATLLRDKIQGAVSTRVARGDRKVEVLVRAPRSDVSERESILGLRVNPGTDRPIPLSVVARVDQQPGPAEIRRMQSERAIVLSAEVENLDLSGSARRIDELCLRLQRDDPATFREISVRIAGQREESERSVESLLFALAIATFLVYIIMAAQFESLHHPLVIMLTIPLALVGVVFALEFLDIKISVVVLLGGILLVGIVVDNAIVMLDCVNQRRRSGIPRNEALIESVALRLRPILMTTLATILGLLPMAVGSGEGKEIQAPMAITVIAGLASSTVLTLLVIPAVYSLVTRPGPIREREAAA